jgi:antitoxin component YwqK of YwqJK toxin-antitoxin module
MKNIFLFVLLFFSTTNLLISQTVKMTDFYSLKIVDGKYFEEDGKLFDGYTGYLLNKTDSILIQTIDGVIFQKIQRKIGTQDGYSERYNAKGNIKRSVQFINGKRDGLAKDYFENGNIETETNYLNGQINGKVIEYFDNGDVKRETNYIDGQRNGKQIEYHPNGEVYEKSNWVNDKIEGTSEYYRENGTIQWRSNYLNGKSDGLTEFFRPDGRKSSSTSYKNGLKNGDEITYDILGYNNIYGKVKYLNNLKEGLELTYGNNYGRLSLITMYKNDKKNGVEEYFNDNGTLTKTITYQSNKIITINKNPKKTTYPNVVKSEELIQKQIQKQMYNGIYSGNTGYIKVKVTIEGDKWYGWSESNNQESTVKGMVKKNKLFDIKGVKNLGRLESNYLSYLIDGMNIILPKE